MEPHGEETAAAVFDFVCLYEEDGEEGRVRSLGEYLRRFPRHEVAIAEEFLRLQREEAGQDAPLQSGPIEPAAAGHDEEPDRVGPYRLLEELGQGGQGSVWVAEDTRIRRTVALKLLAGAFVTDHRRARLRREAEALAALAHPCICPVLDADVEADPPWIAMPVLEGHDLGHALEQARTRAGTGDGAGGSVVGGAGKPAAHGRGPVLLPSTRSELHGLLRFFEAAARATHAAHEAGVVHRDLKPGNLFVHQEGRPVLLDFGLATDGSGLGEALTQSGDVFGTPAYMAPEQHDGRMGEVGPRSDVFALGVTLYEALTGERPFQGASLFELQQAVLHAPVADPRPRCPVAGDDLVAVLRVALDKDPSRRYPSALGLAEDLRRICDYEPVEARPAGPLLRLGRWARRNPGVASGLTATFAVLSVALVVTLDLLADVRAALDLSRGRALVSRVAELVPDRPAAAVALGLEALELAPGPAARSALLEPLLEDRLTRTLRLPSGTMLRALEPVDLGGVEAWVTVDRAGVLRRGVPGGEVAVLGPLPEAFSSDGSVQLCARGSVVLVSHSAAGVVGVDVETGDVLGEPLLAGAGPIALVGLGTRRCLLAAADGSRVIVDMDSGELAEEWPRALPGEAHLVALPGGAAELGEEGLVRLGPEGRALVASDARAAAASGERLLWLDADGGLVGASEPEVAANLTGLAAGDDLLLAWSETRAFLAALDATPPSWTELDLEGRAVTRGSVAPGGRHAALLLSDGSILLVAARGATTGRARDFVRPALLRWSLDGTEVIAASGFELAFAYAAQRPSGCYGVEVDGRRGLRDAAFAPSGAFAWTLDGNGGVAVVETPRAAGASAPEAGARRWARATSGSSLRPSADGERALVWGEAEAMLLEARSGAVLASWQGPLRSAALAPAGDRVALVGLDGRVRIAGVGAGSATTVALEPSVQLAEFNAHGDLVLARSKAPDAWSLEHGAGPPRALAVPSLDASPGTRQLLRSGEAVVLHGQDHHLRVLAPGAADLDPDGRRVLRADWVLERGGVLLTARRGPAVSLRVMRAGQSLRDADQPTLPHASDLSAVDLAWDGEVAVTSDVGGGVVLWSTSTGEVLLSLDGGGDWAEGAAAPAAASAWLDPSPGPVRLLLARGGRVCVVPADLEAVAVSRPGRALASWERRQFELE